MHLLNYVVCILILFKFTSALECHSGVGFRLHADGSDYLSQEISETDHCSSFGEQQCYVTQSSFPVSVLYSNASLTIGGCIGKTIAEDLSCEDIFNKQSFFSTLLNPLKTQINKYLNDMLNKLGQNYFSLVMNNTGPWALNLSQQINTAMRPFGCDVDPRIQPLVDQIPRLVLALMRGNTTQASVESVSLLETLGKLDTQNDTIAKYIDNVMMKNFGYVLPDNSTYRSLITHLPMAIELLFCNEGFISTWIENAMPVFGQQNLSLPGLGGDLDSCLKQQSNLSFENFYQTLTCVGSSKDFMDLLTRIGNFTEKDLQTLSKTFNAMLTNAASMCLHADQIDKLVDVIMSYFSSSYIGLKWSIFFDSVIPPSGAKLVNSISNMWISGYEHPILRKIRDSYLNLTIAPVYYTGQCYGFTNEINQQADKIVDVIQATNESISEFTHTNTTLNKISEDIMMAIQDMLNIGNYSFAESGETTCNEYMSNITVWNGTDVPILSCKASISSGPNIGSYMRGIVDIIPKITKHELGRPGSYTKYMFDMMKMINMTQYVNENTMDATLEYINAMIAGESEKELLQRLENVQQSMLSTTAVDFVETMEDLLGPYNISMSMFGYQTLANLYMQNNPNLTYFLDFNLDKMTSILKNIDIDNLNLTLIAFEISKQFDIPTTDAMKFAYIGLNALTNSLEFTGNSNMFWNNLFMEISKGMSTNPMSANLCNLNDLGIDLSPLEPMLGDTKMIETVTCLMINNLDNQTASLITPMLSNIIPLVTKTNFTKPDEILDLLFQVPKLFANSSVWFPEAVQNATLDYLKGLYYGYSIEELAGLYINIQKTLVPESAVTLMESIDNLMTKLNMTKYSYIYKNFGYEALRNLYENRYMVFPDSSFEAFVSNLTIVINSIDVEHFNVTVLVDSVVEQFGIPLTDARVIIYTGLDLLTQRDSLSNDTKIWNDIIEQVSGISQAYIFNSTNSTCDLSEMGIYLDKSMMSLMPVNISSLEPLLCVMVKNMDNSTLGQVQYLANQLPLMFMQVNYSNPQEVSNLLYKLSQTYSDYTQLNEATINSTIIYVTSIIEGYDMLEAFVFIIDYQKTFLSTEAIEFMTSIENLLKARDVSSFEYYTMAGYSVLGSLYTQNDPNILEVLDENFSKLTPIVKLLLTGNYTLLLDEFVEQFNLTSLKNLQNPFTTGITGIDLITKYMDTVGQGNTEVTFESLLSQLLQITSQETVSSAGNCSLKEHGLDLTPLQTMFTHEQVNQLEPMACLAIQNMDNSTVQMLNSMFGFFPTASFKDVNYNDTDEVLRLVYDVTMHYMTYLNMSEETLNATMQYYLGLSNGNPNISQLVDNIYKTMITETAQEFVDSLESLLISLNITFYKIYVSQMYGYLGGLYQTNIPEVTYFLDGNLEKITIVMDKIDVDNFNIRIVIDETSKQFNVSQIAAVDALFQMVGIGVENLPFFRNLTNSDLLTLISDTFNSTVSSCVLGKNDFNSLDAYFPGAGVHVRNLLCPVLERLDNETAKDLIFYVTELAPISLMINWNNTESVMAVFTKVLDHYSSKNAFMEPNTALMLPALSLIPDIHSSYVNRDNVVVDKIDSYLSEHDLSIGDGYAEAVVEIITIQQPYPVDNVTVAVIKLGSNLMFQFYGPSATYVAEVSEQAAKLQLEMIRSLTFEDGGGVVEAFKNYLAVFNVSLPAYFDPILSVYPQLVQLFYTPRGGNNTQFSESLINILNDLLNSYENIFPNNDILNVISAQINATRSAITNAKLNEDIVYGYIDVWNSYLKLFNVTEVMIGSIVSQNFPEVYPYYNMFIRLPKEQQDELVATMIVFTVNITTNPSTFQQSLHTLISVIISYIDIQKEIMNALSPYDCQFYVCEEDNCNPIGMFKPTTTKAPETTTEVPYTTDGFTTDYPATTDGRETTVDGTTTDGGGVTSDVNTTEPQSTTEATTFISTTLGEVVTTGQGSTTKAQSTDSAATTSSVGGTTGSILLSTISSSSSTTTTTNTTTTTTTTTTKKSAGIVNNFNSKMIITCFAIWILSILY